MSEVKECLENSLSKQYLVSTSVREPTETTNLAKKGRIKVGTSPKRPNIPAQKLSLEIASVPAYTKQPRILQLNVEGPEFGQEMRRDLPQTYSIKQHRANHSEVFLLTLSGSFTSNSKNRLA